VSAGNAVHCRELPLDDASWDAAGGAFDVLRELRTHLERAEFDRIARAGAAQGLRFTGAFDASGRCLGVAGWRILHTTSFGRKLYVDDLVTTAAARSRGVGTALLDHLTTIAREHGCAVVDLDSGEQRLDAHRFYRREGFDERSLHFTRPVRPA
jgi:GNAT superfamily N-acetyltransferase